MIVGPKEAILKRKAVIEREKIKSGSIYILNYQTSAAHFYHNPHHISQRNIDTKPGKTA